MNVEQRMKKNEEERANEQISEKASGRTNKHTK